MLGGGEEVAELLQGHRGIPIVYPRELRLPLPLKRPLPCRWHALSVDSGTRRRRRLVPSTGAAFALQPIVVKGAFGRGAPSVASVGAIRFTLAAAVPSP